LRHRGARQNSRPQSANNPFRHCEHVKRSWPVLRRNACANTSSSNNDNLDTDADGRDRLRGSNTSEYLQKMILRLESLVRQQKALARNSNMNTRLNGNSQQSEARENDNREMEEIRDATRLRAR